MGLPLGYKYLKNMAIYEANGMAKLFIRDYGKDLENHFDRTDRTIYKDRIFCLDCPDFEACRGKWWKGCPNRAEVLRIIKREL